MISCCSSFFRYAVVTGGNKGIGFEICKQLAAKGIVVILTARNERRGSEAVEKLKASGLLDNIVFHQLDVADSSSVVAAADFVRTRFGKLDILVSSVTPSFFFAFGFQLGNCRMPCT